MKNVGESGRAVRSLEECLEQNQRADVFWRAVMGEPLGEKSAQLEALLDAVRLFAELGIPYALAGGVAAMLYGRVRPTEDVDFVAATGHEAILQAHGEAMRRWHFDPGCTWKLYHNSGVTIDIWKDAHADGIAARATEMMLGKSIVRVAEVHDLVAMKLRAGRSQDETDIIKILGHQKVDPARIKELVSGEELARFAAIRERAGREKKD